MSTWHAPRRPQQPEAPLAPGHPARRVEAQAVDVQAVARTRPAPATQGIALIVAGIAVVLVTLALGLVPAATTAGIIAGTVVAAVGWERCTTPPQRGSMR